MNNIMNDNLLYLEAWMNYNPKLRENLTMDGTNLICKINGNLESINIKNFYLPEMLYNEEFRIQVANELEAEDLFEIIKIYVNIFQNQKCFKCLQIKVIKTFKNL